MVIRERASGKELDGFPLKAFHDDVCNYVCNGSDGIVDHDDDDGQLW